MKKINNTEITAKHFAYDGCHKIYLLNTKEDKKEAILYDYNILPIKQLPQCFIESCSLRFIQTWNDFQNIVMQFADKIVFENFNISDNLNKEILGYTCQTINNKLIYTSNE